MGAEQQVSVHMHPLQARVQRDIADVIVGSGLGALTGVFVEQGFPQVLRVVVVGPNNNFYSMMLYALEMHVPDWYPMVPPELRCAVRSAQSWGVQHHARAVQYQIVHHIDHLTHCARLLSDLYVPGLQGDGLVHVPLLDKWSVEHTLKDVLVQFRNTMKPRSPGFCVAVGPEHHDTHRQKMNGSIDT